MLDVETGVDETILQTHIGLSKAREMFSGLMDKVVAGSLRVVDRRKDAVALVPAAAMDQLLAAAYPFKPEVYFDGESGVALWLPELAVGAEGEGLEDAQEALVNAVLDYVASWEEELRRAPNHAARFGWVYRVELAEQPDRIRQMLFADNEAPDLRRAPSFL
jgi:hypothetical protein